MKTQAAANPKICLDVNGTRRRFIKSQIKRIGAIKIQEDLLQTASPNANPHNAAQRMDGERSQRPKRLKKRKNRTQNRKSVLTTVAWANTVGLKAAKTNAIQPPIGPATKFPARNINKRRRHETARMGARPAVKARSMDTRSRLCSKK